MRIVWIGFAAATLLISTAAVSQTIRFSDGNFAGYSLDRSQRDDDFVHFFFGYNY